MLAILFIDSNRLVILWKEQKE